MMTLLWVLAAISVPQRFIERLVDIDLQLELAENEQLAAAGEPRIREFRAELRQSTMSRLLLLRRSLGQSFVTILSAIVVALLVAAMPAARQLMWRTFPRNMSTISVGLFAWATLARLGFLTWSQRTTVERADESFFRLLYWLGTFTGILALSFL